MMSLKFIVIVVGLVGSAYFGYRFGKEHSSLRYDIGIGFLEYREFSFDRLQQLCDEIEEVEYDLKQAKEIRKNWQLEAQSIIGKEAKK